MIINKSNVLLSPDLESKILRVISHLDRLRKHRDVKIKIIKNKRFILAGDTPTFPRGWGNGYCILPKGHFLDRINDEDIHKEYDIWVYGGLTYANVEKEENNRWVIGFDTRHYNDTLRNWPKNEY